MKIADGLGVPDRDKLSHQKKGKDDDGFARTLAKQLDPTLLASLLVPQAPAAEEPAKDPTTTLTAAPTALTPTAQTPVPTALRQLDDAPLLEQTGTMDQVPLPDTLKLPEAAKQPDGLKLPDDPAPHAMQPRDNPPPTNDAPMNDAPKNDAPPVPDAALFAAPPPETVKPVPADARVEAPRHADPHPAQMLVASLRSEPAPEPTRAPAVTPTSPVFEPPSDVREAHFRPARAELVIGEGADQIRLQINASQRVVRVEATTGSHLLTNLLRDGAAELRSALERNGLSLGDLSAETSGGGRQPEPRERPEPRAVEPETPETPAKGVRAIA